MRTSTIDERFSDFLDDPCVERLIAVRDLILRRSDYAPYSAEWQQIEELHQAGEFARVLGAWNCLQPVGLLSPRFHFLAGTAAYELGNLDIAVWERQCMEACLRGLFDTGDGTERYPFLVTYRWDAYDIMRALQHCPRQQMLVETSDGLCDRIVCDGERELWFSVQPLIDRAQRQAGSALRRYLQPVTAPQA